MKLKFIKIELGGIQKWIDIMTNIIKEIVTEQQNNQLNKLIN